MTIYYDLIALALDLKPMPDFFDDENLNSIPEDAELVGLGGVTPSSFKPGHKTWNKGKKCRILSVKRKEAWDKWKEENPNYKDKWKKYQRTGYNSEARSKQAAERNKVQSTCPHCNKTGQNVNMKRWHFENCKWKKSI